MAEDRYVWVRTSTGKEVEVPEGNGFREHRTIWHTWEEARLIQIVDGWTFAILRENGQYATAHPGDVVQPDSPAADEHQFDTETREQRTKRLYPTEVPF